MDLWAVSNNSVIDVLGLSTDVGELSKEHNGTRYERVHSIVESLSKFQAECPKLRRHSLQVTFLPEERD